MIKKEIKKTKTRSKTVAKETKVGPPEKKAETGVKEVKLTGTQKLAERALEGALEKPVEKKRAYLYAVGRRKCAVAQVRLYKNGKGIITINGKDCRQYFPTFEFQEIVLSPLKSVGQSDKLDVEVKVKGGGKRGQAESVRLGIARTLINLNPNFKKNLRRAGFLTRDPRVKERKKYGLKRARRAPQWQKR